MTPILAHIQTLLIRDLGGMKKEIEAFPNDQQIWEVLPGVVNPAGTLAIHLCGNLKHYVGFVMGGIPYTRDRENEFANRSLSKAEISREIESTIEVLKRAFSSIDSTLLGTIYPERVGGFELNTQQFLLHLCSHFALHLGQAGYLRRILSGSVQSTGPASLAEVALG